MLACWRYVIYHLALFYLDISKNNYLFHLPSLKASVDSGRIMMHISTTMNILSHLSVNIRFVQNCWQIFTIFINAKFTSALQANTPNKPIELWTFVDFERIKKIRCNAICPFQPVGVFILGKFIIKIFRMEALSWTKCCFCTVSYMDLNDATFAVVSPIRKSAFISVIQPFWQFHIGIQCIWYSVSK